MLKQATLAAFAAVLLAATSAAALDDPDQLIKGLYALPTLPSKPGDADRWLARDAAQAYDRQLQADEPMPATDGDWRYDSQEWEISDLVISRPVAAKGFGGADVMLVEASFKNFGKPNRVTWTLCLASTGWRIADARGENDGGVWRLREYLEVPLDSLRC